MNNEEIKIKIMLKNKPKLIATANVSIPTIDFGYITIKGFQIWKSELLNSRLQEYINITPPSIGAFGRWIIIIYFEDGKLWQKLESSIYGKFIEARNKMPSDVDIDDISEKIDALNK